MGCDMLARLPKVFHDDKHILSNNKNSYSSLYDDKVFLEFIHDLSSYLNRVVSIKLNSGDMIEGRVLSVNKDTILLDDHNISIDDIVDIK